MIQSYLNQHMDTIPQAIIRILSLSFVCNIFYFFAAVSVYHIPNMGFNTILSSMMSFLHTVLLFKFVH